MKITIPILTNTHYDLSKFNFRFRDIYLVELTSLKLKRYINSFTKNKELRQVNFDFFNYIIKEKHYDSKKYYAIIKKKYKQNYKQEEIYRVFNLLLLIYPSDLYISNEIDFSTEEGELRTTGMSSFPRYTSKFFYSHDRNLKEINRFLKKVFLDFYKFEYVRLAILHFNTSFEASHGHFQYINLCMALETLVEGDKELSYRMKRGVAILVGDNKYSCEIIFRNLGNIYSLRSAIVHGENYKNSKLQEYLPYLKKLVARTILELLLHKLNRSNLNESLTKAGFGQRHLISQKYKPFELSLIIQTDVTIVSLTKYK